MRWKSDWLHRLILRDVEQFWQEMLREGGGGSPPDYLLLSQFSPAFMSRYSKAEAGAEAEPVKLTAGTLVGQWKFDGAEIRVLAPSDTQDKDRTAIRGMFYQVGTVGFIISADRKVVDLSYVVGPHYGRGRVFSVEGQGRTGRLRPQIGSPWWVS